MKTIHPQYITDVLGKKKSVILPLKVYNSMLEAIEELEDIKIYDETKKEDNGERILFSEYLKNRKSKNA
jgi:hypothetical protein